MVREASTPPSTEEVLHRLNILWHKLEGEGMYVGANTVALAEELIRWQSAQLFAARQGLVVSASTTQASG